MLNGMSAELLFILAVVFLLLGALCIGVGVAGFSVHPAIALVGFLLAGVCAILFADMIRRLVASL